MTVSDVVFWHLLKLQVLRHCITISVLVPRTVKFLYGMLAEPTHAMPGLVPFCSTLVPLMGGIDYIGRR